MPTTSNSSSLAIGLDVGSTTVKAVVINLATEEILWSDYQRHDTKQPEKTLELLKSIAVSVGEHINSSTRIFVTGSGGGKIATLLGAKFVQEVYAVALAVEKFYPLTHSVVELGGQDAKIIVFKDVDESGKKKKIPSMNDKCAGGTGAVIDKINAKLQIPTSELCNMGYHDIKLHLVAGKCGVFAESDINGLQKLGVPANELMASLFESIIQQNLSVLTRGHTLYPEVLLLGGPNCYIRGMQECWRANIIKLWDERKVPYDKTKPIEELIRVPDNAQYFAAIGAIESSKEEEDNVGIYCGYQELEHYIQFGREEEKQKLLKNVATGGLAKDAAELDAFKIKYTIPKFINADFPPRSIVSGFIGIDGGSTSTKAVFIDEKQQVLAKAYQLSKGNPIEDTIEILRKLRSQVETSGAILQVLGIGTTGYAKDTLKDVLKADVALVETVAHTQAALHFYPKTDVIVDVGGQDIKLIILDQGRVSDFKLNTQCSAGNGYFLQSTAKNFGFTVEEFADAAFAATQYPNFGYGCAVFMQSDIVDFQRQGWKPEEIMVGLANVLPKNIWLYVSQIPNLAALGTNFILQGGTQYNLAAVKSQVDFIEKQFKSSNAKPDVKVHLHTGEAGAIGCALEAARLYANGQKSTFIGLDKVMEIAFKTTRSEDTRCYFCKNKCLRTFVDVAIDKSATNFIQDGDISGHTVINPKSKVPLIEGTKRIIIATCEKGTVEELDDMKEIKNTLDNIKDATANLVSYAATAVWRATSPALVMDDYACIAKIDLWQKIKFSLNTKLRQQHFKRLELIKKRDSIIIGIPRALNMYAHAPFFNAYFEALGILPHNIVYSEFTDEEMYKAGSRRGSIDPCFPSKVGNAHIHNLVYKHHKQKKPQYIFFPTVDTLPSEFIYAQAHTACPTVTATTEVVKAAFTKESNLFKDNGMEYVNTYICLGEPLLCSEQMFLEWQDKLGLSRRENDLAVDAAFLALENYNQKLKTKARRVIDELVANSGVGIVVLARPYHNDPGINHEILDEFQKLGYPILSQDSLPTDPDMLDELFGDEVRSDVIKSPMDIGDVWKNSYSENTTKKVWAAKFVARHPNLVALELSSFKCGHDAPIYTVVEQIIKCSNTPYFSFKDIDENKPSGAIKIRIETIHYFLTRYAEELKKGKTQIDAAGKQIMQQQLLNELNKPKKQPPVNSGTIAVIDISRLKKKDSSQVEIVNDSVAKHTA